jgi:hypothetical protein
MLTTGGASRIASATSDEIMAKRKWRRAGHRSTPEHGS